MRYHQELPARVRQASPTELARLARLQTLVAQEQQRRPDRPKPRHPFIQLPR